MRSEPATEGTVTPAMPAGARAPRRASVRFGRLAVFLLASCALTGLVLTFYYRPTPSAAYLDVFDLREIHRAGFVRELHRWGATAAVIAVWLHLLRSALRGRYAAPRRGNWNLGVGLMVLTLMIAATGTLLPWDQDGYWGIAVLSPGGDAAPSDSTLATAYVLHCVALPILVAGLVALHVRRARRDAATTGGTGG